MVSAATRYLENAVYKYEAMFWERSVGLGGVCGMLKHVWKSMASCERILDLCYGLDVGVSEAVRKCELEIGTRKKYGRGRWWGGG